MSTKYSLEVVNNADMGDADFCIFAHLPTSQGYQLLALAWITQRINSGNKYTFTWDLDYSFVWNESSLVKGDVWGDGQGFLPADPTVAPLSGATFEHRGGPGNLGDFSLVPAAGPGDGKTLVIRDSATIPYRSEKPSSVGIAIDGKPACVVPAGRNLTQTFTLHPTYYVTAGSFEKGVMVDVADLAQMHQLVFADGPKLSVELTRDNVWAPVGAGALA